MGSTRCWLIGGTGDSAEIARQLSDLAIPYVVTVTTAAARKLYPKGASVEVGKLSPQLAQNFAWRHQVSCIADASHPFASEISKCAIALASDRQIPYLRYERPLVTPLVDTHPTSTRRTLSESSASDAYASNDPENFAASVTLVDSIDALLAHSSLMSQLEHQRILFTIGYRHLEKFASLRATSKLYARILPSPEALSSTLFAGFEASEIIAIRPPVSLALEKALWQQWNISCVVAKCSGELATSASGERIKRQAAQALGVHLIMISRPTLSYPHKTENLADIISFCQDYSVSGRTDLKPSLQRRK